MSVQLTVLGITYDYPAQGDPPPWGSEATDWAVAVTAAIASVVGANDIVPSAYVLANNTSTPTIITGLSFNPLQVYGAVINFSVYQATSTTELSATGTIYASYKPKANTWDIAVVGGGDLNQITFSMLPTGQIQYTNSNLTGTGYTGILSFRAQALET